MRRRGLLRLLIAAVAAPFLPRAHPPSEVASAAGVEPFREAWAGEVFKEFAKPQYGRGRAWISDLPHIRPKALGISADARVLFQGALRPEGPWHNIQADGKLENTWGMPVWYRGAETSFESMPVKDQAWYVEFVVSSPAPASTMDALAQPPGSKTLVRIESPPQWWTS